MLVSPAVSKVFSFFAGSGPNTALGARQAAGRPNTSPRELCGRDNSFPRSACCSGLTTLDDFRNYLTMQRDPEDILGDPRLAVVLTFHVASELSRIVIKRTVDNTNLSFRLLVING
jgi:hypothetical protein